MPRQHAYHRHLHAIAGRYSVRVFYPNLDNLSPYANRTDRSVHIYRIADSDQLSPLGRPVTYKDAYAVALHEIGHCVDPLPDSCYIPDVILNAVTQAGDLDRFISCRSEWRAWKSAQVLAGPLWDADLMGDAVAAGLETYASVDFWRLAMPIYQTEWTYNIEADREFSKRCPLSGSGIY